MKGRVMRMGSMILGMFAAALMVGPVAAQNADNMLDLAYSTFRDRPGWTPFDAEKLAADARAKLSQEKDAPDSRMSPIEKALFYVDMMEPPLKQSRTLLRYGQVAAAGGPVSFIEVDRYNLGTSDDPHVAWRFDFLPKDGATAWLQDALRREIPSDEASDTDCLIAGCLEPRASTDGSFPWKEGQSPATGLVVPYETTTESGHAVSAFAAAEMAVALNIAAVEGGDFSWRGPEQPDGVTDGSPFLFYLDDRSVTAPGHNDAIMGMVRLNDHALAEMWTRRTDDGKAVAWQNAVVTRPGAH